MEGEKEQTVEPSPAASAAKEESATAQKELARMREEFNQQRARMKELYLAKESTGPPAVNEANQRVLHVSHFSSFSPALRPCR